MGITDPDIELINKNPAATVVCGFGPRETGEVDCQELAEIESEDRDGSRGSAGPSSQTVADCPKMDVQTFGLEWLWRLILQPWRIKRQFSLVKYVYLVLKEKMV